MNQDDRYDLISGIAFTVAFGWLAWKLLGLAVEALGW